MIGITRKILDSMLLDITSKHLTPEVLSTLMAEVSAIINARPLVPVSNDQDCPDILSAAMLLTQKPSSPVHFAYHPVDPRVQWKYVQSLADIFWKRWRAEFLSTLQQRRKWQSDTINLSQGDIFLHRNKEVHRNNWPLGVFERIIECEDNKVRKVEVRVFQNVKPKTFLRPISEQVLKWQKLASLAHTLVSVLWCSLCFKRIPF